MTIRFVDSRMEAALTLWGNSSLGLLLHWWQSNKQQGGRGSIGKEALANFICLNPFALSEAQLDAAAALVIERADIPMRPFNEIDHDDARHELDRDFLHDILGLPAVCSARAGRSTFSAASSAPSRRSRG